MAGTVTLTETNRVSRVKKIKWAWTSTAGGAADKVTSGKYYGRVVALVTIPAGGGSAPSLNYDITVTDAETYDVMQGAGANRSDTATETAVPTAYSVAFGALTINVTNAGNAKSGTAILYIEATDGRHEVP